MNGNKGERLYFLNNAMPVISIPVYNLLRNDMRLRKEVPCNFIDVASYGRRTNLVQLSIQAVQLSDTSWNFTGARDCSAFVKVGNEFCNSFMTFGRIVSAWVQSALLCNLCFPVPGSGERDS